MMIRSGIRSRLLLVCFLGDGGGVPLLQYVISLPCVFFVYLCIVLQLMTIPDVSSDFVPFPYLSRLLG